MHRHRSQRLALGILFAAGWLAAAPALRAEEDWENPDKKWIKGPVSYLATEEEEKDFRKRETDADRKAFIDAFWAKRDPSEGTPENEFRDRFYQRVRSADASLREQGIPAGWKSEPGRVLILLGQPADVKFSAADAAGGGAGASGGPSRYGGEGGEASGGETGGRVKFVYPDVTRFGLPPKLDIEFQQEGLAYRLLTRVNLGTDAVRGLDAGVLRAEFPAGAVPEKAISLAPAAPAAGARPALPVATGSLPRDLLLKMLNGDEAPTSVPFNAVADFYKARAGKTYVAITLGLPEARAKEAGLDPANLHPVAALQAVGDAKNLFLYDKDILFGKAEDAGDGWHRFQAGEGADPGTYKMVAGFVSADGTQVGMRVEEVEVPDFEDPGVQLSTVTVTARTEPATEASADVKVPFVLGQRRVVPRVDNTLPLNGTLTLYYQVYNAAPGPDGHPSLRINYNFFRKSGERYIKAGTAPPLQGVKEAVQIYELPLKGWPKGEYKVKVTVTDTVSGSFGEREVSFVVG